MSRPRFCAARGCFSPAVTTIPAPRGIVGRVSACPDCYQRATGHTWNAPALERPARPARKAAPASNPAPRPVEPGTGPAKRYPSGRVVSPSDVRLAEAKGARAARRTVGAVITRLLWWLCETTPEGRYWRVAAAASLAVTPNQVDVAYRYLRRSGWVAEDRSVTDAGRSEASRRRDVQARVTGGEVCDGE